VHRAVLDRGELGAPGGLLLVDVLLRDGVVVVVAVLGPQRVGEPPQRLGQVPVCGGRAGDQRLAAVGRDRDAAQAGGLRRVEDEGDVGVPVVGGPAPLAVDGQHVRGAVDGGHRRMGGGDVAEVADEGLLARVVEALRVEDQGLWALSASRTAVEVSWSRGLVRSRPSTRAPMFAVTCGSRWS
jgi:hypothetical protein